MSTRQVATAGITLALGFILGAMTWQLTFAVQKAEVAPNAAAGRYLPFVRNKDILAMDTATGTVWAYEDNKWWKEADRILAPEK